MRCRSDVEARRAEAGGAFARAGLARAGRVRLSSGRTDDGWTTKLSDHDASRPPSPRRPSALHIRARAQAPTTPSTEVALTHPSRRDEAAAPRAGPLRADVPTTNHPRTTPRRADGGGVAPAHRDTLLGDLVFLLRFAFGRY